VIRADAEAMRAGLESILIALGSATLSAGVLMASTDELVAHYDPSQRERG
jgi:hypothetical protein